MIFDNILRECNQHPCCGTLSIEVIQTNKNDTISSNFKKALTTFMKKQSCILKVIRFVATHQEPINSIKKFFQWKHRNQYLHKKQVFKVLNFTICQLKDVHQAKIYSFYTAYTPVVERNRFIRDYQETYFLYIVSTFSQASSWIQSTGSYPLIIN